MQDYWIWWYTSVSMVRISRRHGDFVRVCVDSRMTRACQWGFERFRNYYGMHYDNFLVILRKSCYRTTIVLYACCVGVQIEAHRTFSSADVCSERSRQFRNKLGPQQSLRVHLAETWLTVYHQLQVRFADANRPHRNSEVTRRDGFPLSSKSNIMAQRANLKGRLPWTMYAEFLEKLKLLWIDQFVLDRNNFSSNNTCMGRFMQNFSSIHMRRKHIERDQCSPWCNRATWKLWNLLKQ